MEVVYARCAGLDVHKKSVVACVLTGAPGRRRSRRVTRTFGTMTDDLEGLADWLAERRVGAVVMEATGVYWKPVYNVLERRGGLTGGRGERPAPEGGAGAEDRRQGRPVAGRSCCGTGWCARASSRTGSSASCGS